jgi:D-alanyl-D-alanine carboxypeptidase (penicillin-binding protein 5/6)
MKKIHLLSFFLASLLAASCLTVPALATGAETTPAETAVTTETLPAESQSSEAAEAQADASTLDFAPTSSVLASDAGIPQLETLDCKAALLVDVDNATVLYNQMGDTRISPADTVKIMTALLTLEAIDRGELTLSTTVTITDTMLSGVSSPTLQSGEQVTVEQLLYLLMLTAKDEMGYALASTVAGSNDAFVQLMNQRAAELGCVDTNFVSPNGSRNSNQYTTCYDLAKITAAALAYPSFREICAAGSYTLPETNLSESRFFYSNNYLVSDRTSVNYTYTYATGVKVGSDYEAGSCIVGSAEYNGRTLLALVMGSTDSVDELGNVLRPGYDMVADLFRYGFVKFYSLDLASQGELVTQVPVTMGKDADFVLLSTASDVGIDLVCGLTADDFDRDLVLPDSIQAPVSAGDVVGQINFSYHGTVYASVDLLAVTDVDLSVSDQIHAAISSFLGHPLVRVVIVVVILAFLVLVIIVITNLMARRRYRKQRNSRLKRKRNKR